MISAEALQPSLWIYEVPVWTNKTTKLIYITPRKSKGLISTVNPNTVLKRWFSTKDLTHVCFGKIWHNQVLYLLGTAGHKSQWLYHIESQAFADWKTSLNWLLTVASFRLFGVAWTNLMQVASLPESLCYMKMDKDFSWTWYQSISNIY